MNTFISSLETTASMRMTENGAIAKSTTGSSLYDLFAFGGSYRERSDNDILNLFSKAFLEDRTDTLKCLFYLRDIRGGAGERRFFRVCMKHIFKSFNFSMMGNFVNGLFENIVKFGRWDDLIYSTYDTPYFGYTTNYLYGQIVNDAVAEYPSLCAKWMPSENASSPKTKEIAKSIRKSWGMTAKTYRKTLSKIRKKINIVERLMSENKWTEIEFDKLPSKAGLKYSHAFLNRSEICEEYKDFINSKNTHVNAKTLYPYDIVHRIMNYKTVDNVNQKYWDNLPDYLGGKPCKILTVLDTSGSMTWGSTNTVTPLEVAYSLGVYCSERMGGAFANSFITFSAKPQFIKFPNTTSIDEKIEFLRRYCINENTNLESVFNLLKQTILDENVRSKDIPETIIIISDMEIDCAFDTYPYYRGKRKSTETTLDAIHRDWAESGLKMPKLVYWNVNARNNTILDSSPYCTYVSGCSPVIFESIVSGKTGIELMYEKIHSDRYKSVEWYC